MTTVVIIAVSVFFLGMGVFAFAAPAALARPFRIAVDAPESRSEIRAVYGGFGVAIAVLLGMAAFDVGGIRPGVVLTVAGALAGRWHWADSFPGWSTARRRSTQSGSTSASKRSAPGYCSARLDCGVQWPPNCQRVRPGWRRYASRPACGPVRRRHR